MIVKTEYLNNGIYKATFEVSGDAVTIEHRGLYTAMLDLIDAEMVKRGVHNYGVDHAE